MQLESQEVFATQAWELSYEKQQDGWVDPGDRILITTEIFTYDSLVSNLIFTNPTSSPYLSLLPHTVETSHGTVTTTDDANKVEVRAISLKSIKEKVVISFEYEVDYPLNQANEISILNQAFISMADYEAKSNIIDIAIKGHNQVQEDSLLANKYVLLGIVALLLLLGVNILIGIKIPAKMGLTA